MARSSKISHKAKRLLPYQRRAANRALYRIIHHGQILKVEKADKEFEIMKKEYATVRALYKKKRRVIGLNTNTRRGTKRKMREGPSANGVEVKMNNKKDVDKDGAGKIQNGEEFGEVHPARIGQIKWFRTCSKKC